MAAVEKVQHIAVDRLEVTYYCDDCGKKLMKAIECGDGYIPTPKEFFIGPYCLGGYHCEECAKKRIDVVLQCMKDQGFGF